MRPYLACLLAPILLLSTSGSYKSADPREAVRAVLDSIAADLVANNRASLVARYDKRGAILLGNWGLKAYPYDSLPTQVYGAGWSPPVRFAWRNVTIEALSARSAVVYAQFIWHSAERDSSVNSYTGVFLHDVKRWRVRVAASSNFCWIKERFWAWETFMQVRRFSSRASARSRRPRSYLKSALNVCTNQFGLC